MPGSRPALPGIRVVPHLMIGVGSGLLVELADLVGVDLTAGGKSRLYGLPRAAFHAEVLGDGWGSVLLSTVVD